MASHRKKEMGAILARIEKQGWDTELRDSGHYALYAPDGETIVFCASTPSDHRAIKNLRSRLRREGADL